MSQISHYQLLAKIEEYESFIDRKYSKLLQTNEQAFRHIDEYFRRSLSRKETEMRNIMAAVK